MASKPFSKPAGATACSFDRLDLLLVRSVAEEARAQHLPLATHTGDARDVADAVEIGSASVEHGSWRDEIPDRLLERMAREGVYLDPTLGVARSLRRLLRRQGRRAWTFAGAAGGSRGVAARARAIRRFRQGRGRRPRRSCSRRRWSMARANLLRAWKAGVPLVMGTRLRQSAGLPRPLAASRIAALGGRRESPPKWRYRPPP